ncbi:MAG: 30S ribosomal protein S6 [Candidatus Campbellbacteria bacterium]|nr:30S ribosomal protein S6 [Candidatus Campbellbacteria bacterium]
MNDKNTEGVVYEIGFHLIPLVSEDEVASHVSKIKSILDDASAEIVSEEFPKLIELAYPISKKVKGGREDFDTAYFGWIKFESATDKIGQIDQEVRNIDEVLRHIVVKTLREDTRINTEKEEEEPDEEEVSEEEMDKTIDDLVIE